MKKFTLLLIAIFSISLTFAQSTVTGTVTDTSKEVLPGANVIEKGTTNGTSTDFNGKFTLTVKDGAVLVVSFTGYETKEVAVNGKSNLNIVLSEGMQLDEVVVTGNRAKPRTILDSPVPIDNIDVKELQNSGKATLDRMLTFKVPSFNSQNQSISDATAHYDPADLRGLGPSRTLVLINGKRKNQSAQVYLNRTPGKGEVGVDLKSIPTAAIDRVEVLRDGASALYGSDAIAGVMNIILKKNVQYSTFTSKAGLTSQKDGFNLSADYNTSFEFGDGGFVNLTLGYYKQQITNRAGTPGAADLPANPLPNWVAWANANPDLGMHVGQPEMEKKDLFVNLEHPLGKKATLYSFHGYTTREGQSFAYYRAPYWRQADVGNLEFITRKEDFFGYQPTFETEINDHINTVGIKYPISDKWNSDMSITYGSNDDFYTVNNSVNRDYLKDHGTSPRSFKPGGYRLTNIIANYDVNGQLSEKANIAFGLEYKKESFRAYEGDPFSYYKGGSDSFAGIKPAEAGIWTRSNFAAAMQLDYDFTENFLIGIAGRYEDFSDFGSNFSWKVSSRYKLGEKGALRASYSTGFRAPTLHQRYLTNSQYIIVAGSSEPLLQGTLANDNAAVKALGVPSLFAETAKNISAGMTYKFNRNFSGSIDFYQIKVDDRVLFSSQIGSLDGNLDGSDAVEQILVNNNVVAVQFFINAGNTNTTGADITLNYRNIEVGSRKLNISFASNFNETTIDAITTPSALSSGGYDIFNKQEQGLITNSRPKSKMILGLNLVNDKWDWSLNNTRFGEVIITAGAGGTNQTLNSKIATDIAVNYKLTDKISLNGNINNIFDVYPDVTLKSTNTSQAGSRFKYSSEVQQLGMLGTNFSAGLTYQF